MNGISFGTPTGKPHDLRDAHCELRDTKTITGHPHFEMVLLGCGCGMTSMVALAGPPPISLGTATAASLFRAHSVPTQNQSQSKYDQCKEQVTWFGTHAQRMATCSGSIVETPEASKTNREKFITAYAVNLAKAVEKFPDAYQYEVESVPVVVEKMVAAIDKGSFNKDSRGIRWTCKELGIKSTYKAIAEFWKG